MRLFLDTNVVLSAVLFPDGMTATFFRQAITDHSIVLSAYVIEELRAVFARKFPAKVDALEVFLTELTFETIDTPKGRRTPKYPGLRDPKDAPIVEGAIRSSCDYLITGDNDLHAFEHEGLPQIVSPGEFLSMTDASEVGPE